MNNHNIGTVAINLVETVEELAQPAQYKTVTTVDQHHELTFDKWFTHAQKFDLIIWIQWVTEFIGGTMFSSKQIVDGLCIADRVISFKTTSDPAKGPVTTRLLTIQRRD